MTQFDSVLELSSLTGANGYKIYGTADDEVCGGSIAAAGDLNGDGFADLIIGAPESFQSFVVFGGSAKLAGLDAFDASVDGTIHLDQLDGNKGFKIDTGSFVASLDLGTSAAGVGDINGDGFNDVLLGTGVNYSVLVFGRNPAINPFPPVLHADVINGSNGYVFYDSLATYSTHDRVGLIGDMNDDGVNDFAISDMTSSVVYVVFGGAANLASLDGDDDGRIALDDIDGTNGFTVDGETGTDRFGSALAGGDINGDGIADLIVGAEAAAPSGAGSTYIIFGHGGSFDSSPDVSTLDGTNGYKIKGEFSGDDSGQSVGAAGDVNGDGIEDVIVGAWLNGGTDKGAAYVLFGGSHLASLDAADTSGADGVIELAEINGSDGFRLSGAAPGDFAGFSVSSAGDVNGDGFDDVIVGAYNTDPHGELSGTAYVVFGKAAGFAVNTILSNLDGDNGFAVNGAKAGDYAGFAVSGGGDINGDGFADLLVSAPQALEDGHTSAGASYIIFGHKPLEAVTRTGTAIANTIHGSDFADTLTGLGGGDNLIGHNGADSLIGGLGNDRLTGGIGRDVMIGGANADTFDFNTVGETGKTAATRDRIVDFSHPQHDHIDVSTIDANGAAPGNKFIFLAGNGAAFTGVKGQLHWFQQNPAGTAQDKTIVEGDINGDKHADFQIELTGLKALTAGDFLL